MMLKLKKIALLLLALVACAPFARAQAGGGTVDITLQALYDLDSTSYTYCRTTGQGGQVLSSGTPENILVTTSGSSTTVAAVTASSAPFARVAVGDFIYFVKTQTQTNPSAVASGVLNERKVTAKASSDSITVESAISLPLAGTTFRRRTTTCGTTAADGWVSVRTQKEPTFTFMLNQGVFGAGGVDARFECRNLGVDQQPVAILTPTTFSTPGIAARQAVIINGTWDECRVGYKLSGSDDGDDLTTNAEQITVQYRSVILGVQQ